MSKVLVIRGAVFSDNKLDTITFDDVVPCTGISLNVSSVTITAWDGTYQLVPTLTPSSTTDGVTWTSSNENVATVSSNGLVTSKNTIGTATITAHCGEYSASCVVSTVVTFADTDLLKVTGYGVIANSYTAGNDAAQFVANPTYPIVGYGLETGLLASYDVAVNSGSTVGQSVYPIPIPANASTLKITLPDALGTKLRLCNLSYHNAETLQTSVANVTACKYVGYKSYNSSAFGDSGTTLTIDLSTAKPSGADSICLYVQTTGSSVSVTDPITLEFY